MRIVEIPLVPHDMTHVVSDNERIHWSQRYQTQQFWRGLALLLFKNTMRFERAKVTVTFRWPDRRRRDVHNYMRLVVKPIIDGIVEAGVLPDDDDKHLIGPDPRVEADPGPFRVLVRVEEET